MRHCKRRSHYSGFNLALVFFRYAIGVDSAAVTEGGVVQAPASLYWVTIEGAQPGANYCYNWTLELLVLANFFFILF